jgi:hypothetical protein
MAQQTNEHLKDRNSMIANGIISQLGGYNKLDAMVGLKDVLIIDSGLSFKIKYKGASANYVKIKLNSLDLYEVEFGFIQGHRYAVKKKLDGIYNDQLVKAIERNCNVYLSL